MLYEIVLLCVCCSTAAQARAPYYGHPEQIHLSYGDSPSEMIITWNTLVEVNESVVEYGINDLNMVAKGHVNKFVDGGKLHRVEYIHTVKLNNLVPSQRYVYHVGSPSKGWSSLYFFTAMTAGTSWSPSIALYGDLGTGNSESLPYLEEEAQNGGIHAVLHVGDMAYNLNFDDGKNGDEFMNQIQNIAAYVPYMTCPGNHEYAYNFSHYKNRFGQNNMFNSFNIGHAHFISINTEVYEKDTMKNIPITSVITQYNWLMKDLKQANAERHIRPWIIVFGHRPMYCSTIMEDHCLNPENPIRVGLNATTRAYSLEDLFYKYGVDLQFYAHEHNYERIFPIYNNKVCNGTKGPYIEPGAPVQIVTGSAGNQEFQHKFMKNPFPYSAFRTEDYGYTKMVVHNNTHISLKQIAVKKNGTVIDSIEIIKTKHGQGLYNCT